MPSKITPRVLHHIRYAERMVTYSGIAQALGVSVTSVHKSVAALRAEQRVHLGGWMRPKKRSSTWTMLWAYGPGIDAPKPGAK